MVDDLKKLETTVVQNAYNAADNADYMFRSGWVWKPDGYGGIWVQPETVRLHPADISLVAEAVVALIKREVADVKST